MMFRTRHIVVLLFAALPIFTDAIPAQQHFNVTFRLDFSSVDALIQLTEGKIANVDRVAELRGNQIAAATSALLAREPYSRQKFSAALDRFRNGAGLAEDIFGLSDAVKFLPQLKELSKESKRRNLDRKVLATISQFFPPNARISASIPVYFVALGNENAAAFVRSIVWRDNIPVFVAEGDGEPTIVVNLTRSVEHLPGVNIQIVDMMSTLAHEAFHAVFGVYQQSNPVWKSLQQRPEPYWVLAEVAQNEGIAYLISLQQRSGGNMNPQQIASAQKSVAELNEALRELTDPGVSPARARELILNSNLSGSYEKNYGATAGLYMAHMIELKLGRTALTETLDFGIADFFEKYQRVAESNGGVPPFDEGVLKMLLR